MLFGDPANRIATIALALDRVQYIAGDMVRGSVRITARERFECTSILVIATGLETANWNHDPEPGRFRTLQNVCFKQEIMVSPANRVFERGDHACNFECALPLVLPGSFVLPASYNPGAYVKYTSASIEYKFEATMEFLSLEEEGSRSGRHLHTAQGFIVHETHPELLSLPRMDQRLRWPVGTCCLFRGNCDFRARLESDVFCQGDRVEVVCDVANDSSVTIPAITCRLIQHITLRLRDQTHVEEREVGAWMYAPVLAREHITRPHVFKLEATGGPMASEVLASPSTTNGTVVKCHYMIQVEAYVPRGGDLELRLPITIQSLLHKSLTRDSSI